MQNQKYKRSLHAQCSLGSTSDDGFMPEDFFKTFQKQNNVILEKLDGQNNCFTKDGLFARSHVIPSELPWDTALRNRWKLIRNDLNELQIFGEGMYGQHSIGYNNLESYFYVFGVRVGDEYLGWEDVKLVAEMFDFPTVPEIAQKKPLQEYKSIEDSLHDNLGMTWEEYTKTPGALGGYNVLTNEPACEGFVVRKEGSFKEDNSGSKLEHQVQPNEFADLFKIVREGHVQTDEHWTKNWTPNKLKDYKKYNWNQYNYLSNKRRIQDVLRIK